MRFSKSGVVSVLAIFAGVLAVVVFSQSRGSDRSDANASTESRGWSDTR